VRAKPIAVLLGVPMPWEKKGSRRNRWGLFLHGCAGAGVAYLVRSDPYVYETAAAGMLLAIFAGVAWEVLGWRVMRWPGNVLDVIPWGLGAGLVGLLRLVAFGF